MVIAGKASLRGLTRAAAGAVAVLVGVAGFARAAPAPTAAGGEDVYFVQRRVYTPEVARPGAVSKAGPRSAGAAKGRTGPGTPPAGAMPNAGSVDEVVRTDGRGNGPKVLLESGPDWTIRAMSISADGSRIVCHLVSSGLAPAGATRNLAAFASRIIVLRSDGKVEKEIDLGGEDLRVWGTPVLLPNGRHVGLTICRLAGNAAPRRTPPPPVGARGAPAAGWKMSDISAGRHAWDPGTFPSQPVVATIGLDGRDLKEIAPGAQPCWSPDGATILYTDVKVAQPNAEPGKPRLSAMKADGSGSHPVAPEMTSSGWFSADGKRIAYVAAGDRSSSQIFTARADGSDARPLKLPPSLYAAPRWLADGKTIELQGRGEPDAQYVEPGRGAAGAAAPRKRLQALNSVCVGTTDGAAELRHISPRANDFNPRGSGLDEDAEAYVTRLAAPAAPGMPPPMDGVTPPPPPGAERLLPLLPEPPGGAIRSIPEGKTVQSIGIRLYLRDASGKLTPLPDGDYRLPDGRVVHVRGGESKG